MPTALATLALNHFLPSPLAPAAGHDVRDGDDGDPESFAPGDSCDGSIKSFAPGDSRDGSADCLLPPAV